VSGLVSPYFPRASAYNPDWILATVSGGANSLWLTEWLTSAMDLRPGMRVLDLGCGRGASSVFLHREFGVDVWATDLWFDADDRARRIRDAGVDAGVTVVAADARSLPFSPGFFDAIVSIDSFFYYGTDDLYLNYLARYLKPGGTIGIAGAGLMREVTDGLPAHLRAWWTQDLWCLHSPDWWRRHWQKTGLVDVLVADTMPDGWQRWLDWHRTVAPDNAVEISALEEDRGRYLGYARVVARRTSAEPAEVVTSIEPDYTPAHLLREARSDEHVLRALATRMVEAEVAGDADTLAAMLADDVILMPPVMPAVEGKAECLQMIREVMRRNATEVDRRVLSYTTAELTVTGSVAIERGVYQHEFVIVDTGEPREERGQYLRVFRRLSGGSWQVHRVIWNTLSGEDDEG
jgi:ketosteroid isomerase-like protein